MLKRNLDKGQSGEKKVIASLKAGGYDVLDWTDYDKYKAKQHKGYDIEILNTTTNEYDRVDIKTNIKNDYIYLEVKSNFKLGWFWTSSADSIYHYDIIEDQIFGYQLKKMKNYIFKNKLKPEHGRFKDLIGLSITDNKIIKKIL